MTHTLKRRLIRSGAIHARASSVRTPMRSSATLRRIPTTHTFSTDRATTRSSAGDGNPASTGMPARGQDRPGTTSPRAFHNSMTIIAGNLYASVRQRAIAPIHGSVYQNKCSVIFRVQGVVHYFGRRHHRFGQALAPVSRPYPKDRQDGTIICPKCQRIQLSGFVDGTNLNSSNIKSLFSCGCTRPDRLSSRSGTRYAAALRASRRNTGRRSKSSARRPGPSALQRSWRSWYLRLWPGPRRRKPR